MFGRRGFGLIGDGWCAQVGNVFAQSEAAAAGFNFTQRPQRRRNARNVSTRSARGVIFLWRSWREIFS